MVVDLGEMMRRARSCMEESGDDKGWAYHAEMAAILTDRSAVRSHYRSVSDGPYVIEAEYAGIRFVHSCGRTSPCIEILLPS